MQRPKIYILKYFQSLHQMRDFLDQQDLFLTYALACLWTQLLMDIPMADYKLLQSSYGAT